MASPARVVVFTGLHNDEDQIWYAKIEVLHGFSGPSWVLITEHMLPPVNSDLVGSEGLRRPTELT